MSAQMEPDFFAALEHEQAMRKPSQVDANQWAARWLFVPFRDRPLPVDHQQNFGLPILKAGYLLPLTKFDQPVLDNWELTKVPVGRDGQFMPADEGISKMVPIPRAPYRVLQGILRIFNPNVGDAIQDNGICEVPPLFGVEDMSLVRRVQLACLPQVYATCREQLAQLDSVRSRATDALIAQVAERLHGSTLQARRHFLWHCEHKVEAALENPRRTGKEELSELDHAAYAWLERPEPKKRSLLTEAAGQPREIFVQAPSSAAVVPQVQCQECGSFVNLLASGLPPAFCPNPGCQKPIPKPTAEEMQAVLDEANETPQSATERRAAKAAEMRQRQGKA